MAALREDPGATEVRTAARLVREPQNPYDRNAVRVEIHGRPSGRLSREDAEDIQPWLKKWSVTVDPRTSWPVSAVAG